MALIDQMYAEFLDVVLERNTLRRQLEQSRLDNRPKLGKGEVSQIREMGRAGVKIADIADSFDVNKSTVSRILKGVYHK